MEYRQLGTPRLQPQQQIGGFNYQASRDLGAEQFRKSFAGLSQSLVAAGTRWRDPPVTEPALCYRGFACGWRYKRTQGYDTVDR